jgi:signal transduction histidine kinase
LKWQLIDEVKTLARAASTDLEMKDGHPHIEDIDQFNGNNQAVQWFDAQGQQLIRQGKHVLTIPLNPKKQIQVQQEPLAILGVTLSVHDKHTNQLVGFVRASETLEGLNNTIHRLDVGLGGSILVALLLSGLSGIWFIRQVMQPIQQSFQKLQQFTADASHELRSPLMAIKSNASVALRYPEGIRDSDIEKFHAIASATQQMTQLTEDLLLLARADRAIKPRSNTVNLTAILKQLVHDHLPQAQDKQIELRFQISEQLYSRGDSVQLTRLFKNLIENALHYTPEQGTVSIDAIRAEHHLIINVQDTGVGIAPEHLPFIFDRFWRADRSRARWTGGSGLGLAIAKSIAQSHSGKITVTSQLSVGSCFTVSLPAHDA